MDNAKEYGISAGDEESELAERARRAMRDRFGLTLPTLRGRDVPSDENSDSENDSRRCTSAGNSSKNRQDGTAIASDDGTSKDRNANSNSLARGRSTADVIDEMISSMPPHVRAAAERRPDLASKLFSEREEPHSSMFQQSHRRTTVAPPSVLEEDISLQSEDGVGISRPIECLSTAKENKQ